MTYPDYSIPFLNYLRALPTGYLRLLPGADRHPWFHTGMHYNMRLCRIMET